MSRIDWNWSSRRIYDFCRSLDFQTYKCAEAVFFGNNYEIRVVSETDYKSRGNHGELWIKGSRVFVKTSTCDLELLEIKKGGRIISMDNFIDDFDRRIIEVRKLEAQKHHQKDMYAKPLQNKRKDKVIEVMKKYCMGNDFYDIGCAEGLFCNLAMSFGASAAKGIDVVEDKIAKAQFQFPDCQFEVADCLDLQEKNQYGMVLCSEVLQHIVNYKKCLTEIVNLLSEKGLLILTTPNLSQKNSHEFAELDPESPPADLLKEIGGASFGKQNAIWKFNTKLLYEEIEKDFSLKPMNYIKIGAEPINNQTIEQASNLFTVMVFKK